MNCRKDYEPKSLINRMTLLVNFKYNRPELTNEEKLQLHMELLVNLASNYGGNVAPFIQEGSYDESFVNDVWEDALNALRSVRTAVTKKAPRDVLTEEEQKQLFADYIKSKETPSEKVDNSVDIEEEAKREESQTETIKIIRRGDGQINVEVEEEFGMAYTMFTEDPDWHPVPRTRRSLGKFLQKELADADPIEFEGIQNFFRDIVSKAYLDNDVDVRTNKVIGYRSPGKMIKTILNELNRNVYSLEKARAGKVMVIKEGAFGSSKRPKYELVVFENEQATPQYMNPEIVLRNAETGEALATIYVDKILENNLGMVPKNERGKVHKYKKVGYKARNFATGIVIHKEEGLEDALLNYIAEVQGDKGIMELAIEPVSENLQKALGHIDQQQIDKIARWSHIINKDVGAFMKELFEPMYSKSAEKYRTSYADELGAISQADQESKRTKFTKSTTPRITFKSWDAPVVQDIESPYLTPEDFDTVAEILSGLVTKKEKYDFLRTAMIHDENPVHRSIYASIYFRFYADEDYSMKEYDPILNDHKYELTLKRSFAQMAGVDMYKTKTEAQFFAEEKNTISEDLEEMKSETAVVQDSLIGIDVSLATNSTHHRYLSSYGNAKISNASGGDVETRFYNKLITHATERTEEEGGITDKGDRPKLDDKYMKVYNSRFITVNAKDSDNIIITIKFKKDRRTEDSIVFKARRNFEGGIPLYLEEISQPLSEEDRFSIFYRLGIYEEYLERNVLNKLNYNIINGDSDPKIINKKLGVESFLINIVYMLSQFDSKGALQIPLATNTEFSMWGLKNTIIKTFEAIEGSTSKKSVQSIKNIKIHTRNPVSPLRRTKMMIEYAKANPKNINHGSWLLSGGITVDTVNSEAGQKLHEIAKSSNQFSEREYLQYLIDQGFIQRGKATKWKNVMVRMGVMSDRKDRPLFNIRSTGDFEFLPVKNGRFDSAKAMSQTLRSQRALHVNLEKKILKKWKQEILPIYYPAIDPTTIHTLKDLDVNLAAIPYSYNQLKKNTNLVSNLMIHEGVNGEARISTNIINSVELFRSAKETFIVQNWRSYIRDKYGEKIASNLYSIEDVKTFLNDMNIPLYEMIEKVGGRKEVLINFGVVAGDGGAAILSASFYDSLLNLKHNKLAKELIKISESQFIEYAKEKGFTQEHMKFSSVLAINKKLTGIEGDVDSVTKKRAYDTALKGYFYTQLTMGDEIQRIHSGTSYQYKQINEAKNPLPQSKNLYDLSIAFLPNGELDEDYILRTAEQVVLNTGEIDSKDRLMWVKRVLESSNPKKAETLLIEDLNFVDTLGWVEQTKRNAGPGSIGQSPSLVSSEEIGAQLELESNYLLYKDPSQILKAIGVHADVAPTDIYDAVIMVHPASLIYFNNSLGNQESNFSSDGAPIKDIHTALTEDGAYIYNKRAVFNIFNNEFMQDTTSELYQIYKKANTAITYGNGNGIDLWVPEYNSNGTKVKNAEFKEEVTPEMWTEFGLSLGLVSYKGKIRHTREILESIRTHELSQEEFIEDLKNGALKTNRIKKNFLNYQELWEYFGSINNENSTEDVVSVIAYYSGQQFQVNNDVRLEKATHPLRSGFVEMIGFGSAQKTGTQQMMPAADFKDPSRPDSGFTAITDTGIPIERYFKMNNTNRLIILQAGHEPDTTATINKRVRMSEEHAYHKDDNDIALVTQLVSALMAQGWSQQEVEAIQDSLADLSSLKVELMSNEITDDAELLAMKKVDAGEWDEKKKSDFMDFLSDEKRRPPTNITELRNYEKLNADYLTVLESAYWGYYRKKIRQSLDMRGDSSALEDLVNHPDFMEKFSFDLMQVLPFTQNMIYARYNKAGIRYRLPGGQFVVAPAHDMMRTYKAGDVEGLTRSELNKLVYFTYPNGIPTEGALPEGVPTYELKDITPEQVRLMIPNDYLVPKDYGGEPINLATIKHRLWMNFNRSTSDITFEEHFETIVAQQYQSRLTSIGKLVDGKGGDRLQWQRYFNKHGVNALDTPEYEAFSHSNVSLVSFAYKLASTSGISLEDAGSRFFSDTHEGGPPKLNKVMAKFYFFSEMNDTTPGFTPEARAKRQGLQLTEQGIDAISLYWSKDEEVAFEQWFKDIHTNPGLMAQAKQEVFMWLYNRETAFNRREIPLNNEELFKAHLQEYLADPELNWYTQPAEFYMPSMHKQAFLIQDTDTMGTFLGYGKQPDIGELIKAGVFQNIERSINDKKISFSPIDQAKRVDRTYLATGKKVIITLYEKLLSSDKEEDQRKAQIVADYMRRKDAQMNHLKNFYEMRVQEWLNDDEVGLFKFSKEAIDYDSQGNMLINYNVLKEELINKRDKYVIGEELHNVFNNLLLEVKEVESNPRLTKEFKTRITYDITSVGTAKNGRKPNIIEKFIAYKAMKLTNSFSQSLEFITARIPAQGKQSGIVGKVKSFVNSTKNSSYGPIELILITGGDYDIDKQNMMTWSVDSDGEIVDFMDYMTDEDMRPNKEALEKRKQLAIDKVRKKYGHLKNTAEGALNKNFEKELKQREQRAVALEIKRFSWAVQNFVVYNIIRSIENPINAIETNTPVDADTAKQLVEPQDYEAMDKSNFDTPSKALTARGETINRFSPSSMFKYTKINDDGNDSIGIFASDLKAYLVATAALLISSGGKYDTHNMFKSQFNSMVKGEKFETANAWTIKNGYGKLDPTAIQYAELERDTKGNPIIGPNGEPIIKNIKQLKYLSNTEIHMTKEGRKKPFSKEMKETIQQIKNAPTEEAQVKLILKHTKNLIQFKKQLAAPQAWEALSELLTAATDNAKLLILGHIGANNTTNSIISTMIRAGLTLEESIGIIQDIRNHKDKDINSIFTQVQDFKDTQADKDTVPTYSSVIKAILDVMEKKNIKFENITDTNISKYLSHPLARLLPFAKMTEEFSIISKVASINQGMPVPIFESWRFINGIEESLNNMAIEWNREQRKDGSGLNFEMDVEDFIKNAAVGKVGPESEVHDIIHLYDQFKTGLNVPHIIKNSPQFFNYFLAMFAAKTSLNSMTKTYEILDILQKRIKATEGNWVRDFDDKTQRGTLNYIYGVGIDLYYNLDKLYEADDAKPPELRRFPTDARVKKLDAKYVTLRMVIDDPTAGELRVVTNSYDLSLPSSKDSNIGGRLEFIKDMPAIKAYYSQRDDLKDNKFLISMDLDSRSVDYETQEELIILKAVNTAAVPEELVIQHKRALDQISDKAPELYNALFQYTLITTRGKYGGGSWASLMDAKVYMDYSEFLRKHIVDIKEIIEDPANYNMALMNIPQVIRTRSTNKTLNEELRRKHSTGSNESEESLYDIYDNEFQDPAGYEDIGQSEQEEFITVGRADPSKRAKKLFYLSYLNERKRKDLKREEGRQEFGTFFRSLETGMVYIWNEDLLSWVPIQQNFPMASIPTNIMQKSNPKAKQGATEGFDIVKDGKIQLTVMSYVDPKYALQIKLGKIDVLKENIEDDFTSGEYYVVRQNGKYGIKPKTEIVESYIKDSKSSLLLDGPKIVRERIRGDRAIRTTDVSKFYREKTTGALYVIKPLYKDVEEVAVRSVETHKIDSTHNTIYNTHWFTHLHDVLSKSNLRSNFSITNVNTSYELLRTELMRSYLKVKIGRDSYVDMVLQQKLGGEATKSDYAEAYDIVGKAFPNTATVVEKLIMLVNANKLIKEKLDPVIRWDISQVQRPKKKQITDAHLDIINNERLIKNTSLNIFEEFLNTIPGAGAPFHLYLEQVVFKDSGNYSVYIQNNRRAYLAKNKKEYLESGRVFNERINVNNTWDALYITGAKMSLNGITHIVTGTIKATNEHPERIKTVYFDEEGERKSTYFEKNSLMKKLERYGTTFDIVSGDDIKIMNILNTKGTKLKSKTAEYEVLSTKADKKNPDIEKRKLTLQVLDKVTGLDNITTITPTIEEITRNVKAGTMEIVGAGTLGGIIPDIKPQWVMVPSNIRAQNLKKVSKEFILGFARRIAKIVPNVEVRVLNTVGIQQEFGIVNAEKLRGFVKGGTIVFNEDNINLDTPIHEFAHIYLEHLKWDNPALYARLVSTALTTDLASEMQSYYAQLKLTPEDFGEEVVVEMIARSMTDELVKDEGYKKIEAEMSVKTPFDKMYEWFERLFHKIFGIDKRKFQVKQGDTFGDILEKIGSRIVYGKTSILSESSTITKKLVDMSRRGAAINMVEAKKLLVDAGYIVYRCN